MSPEQTRSLLFLAVVFGGPIVFGVWRIRRERHDKRAFLDLAFAVLALSALGILGEFFAMAQNLDLPALYDLGPSLRSALLLSACVLVFLPRAPEETAAPEGVAEVEAFPAKAPSPASSPLPEPVADLEIEVAPPEADDTSECPYCRGELRVGAADATQCQTCAAWAHSECWQENRDQCPACVYAS